MQPLFKKLMQDLVGFSLNVNIHIWMSNMAEKRLLDHVVEIIKYCKTFDKC